MTCNRFVFKDFFVLNKGKAQNTPLATFLYVVIKYTIQDLKTG